MRAHDYPEFKFLVEPRELSDEEAFRIADLENRSRRDLSDFERAYDYARAIDRYYGGSQQRMADRLEVSKSWLSRYLELAKLPPEIVAAFGSPHVIGISHGAALAPLLRVPEQRNRLIAEAKSLGAEQASLVGQGLAAPTPASVLQRLLAAARPSARARAGSGPQEHVVRSAGGMIVARGQKAGRGDGLTISVPAPAKHDRAALMAALGEILDRVTPAPAARKTDDKRTPRSNVQP